MSHTVQIECPDGQIKTIPLTGERIAVGRSAAAELCFPEDAALSRQHFAFEKEGDDWTVQDLGSKLGTLLNNIPLKARVILRTGDRIIAGHLVLIYDDDLSELPRASYRNLERHVGDVEKYRKDIRSYQIQGRPFAFGRASALYQGIDVNGNPVCIKVYHKTRGIYVDNFARELTALQSLRHPNILPVLGFGIDATDSPFIVLPMCLLGDLRKLLLQGGRAFLPISEALVLLRQVASAIDFAHTRGFIHGDIKPENILRSVGSQTFLSDFGMSRYIMIQENFSSGTSTVEPAEANRGGSTAYLSPEQIDDNRQTLLSDIYSFSVVVYEVLTGQLPFDTRLPPFKQMATKVKGALIHPQRANRLLPDGAAEVLLQGLETDESRRLTTATELCIRLAASDAAAKRIAKRRGGRRVATNGDEGRRPCLFVSYSHLDKRWVHRICMHLRPLERQGRIELWADDKITPGTAWREEIEKAIQSSSLALLLISASYVASDYIANRELPSLLLRAKAEGLLLLSVFVSPCSHDPLLVSEFQALNDPDRTLLEMDAGEQERVLAAIASRIAGLLSDRSG